MNLCTDQLAMLLADEGQLYSVSYLAGDMGASVLAERAKAYVVNHGLAEEIFLMQPDLIIAGSYTTRATVDMLKRLGFRVEEFEPESSFDDIRSNIIRMGKLLGQEAKAREMIRVMDERLARIRESSQAKAGAAPTIALYYANQLTSGKGTLADDVVRHAGLVNLGEKLGMQGTQKLPLEQLVMAKPDLVAAHNAYPTPALAYEAQVHPAFRATLNGKHPIDIPDKYWICGGPFTVDAVQLLAEQR
ncbi:ABC transporter substrate-binding protein [Phyllobacterium sp. SB3]|uniref:ABC transporter substrate-binding protein n=1 Tax=Phyllobacterium sp. SB3 TaxID=3156073 RepID=UPI0032AF31E3